MPKNAVGEPDAVFGKMEIIWRGQFGEPGRLQTNPVSRKAQVKKDVRFFVVSHPQEAVLEQPFEAQLAVMNKTSKTIFPRLCFAREAVPSAGVVMQSPGGVTLGPVEPGATSVVPVVLLPLLPGLQFISALRLEDVGDSGEVHELDTPAPIMVTQPETL